MLERELNKTNPSLYPPFSEGALPRPFATLSGSPKGRCRAPSLRLAGPSAAGHYATSRLPLRGRVLSRSPAASRRHREPPPLAAHRHYVPCRFPLRSPATTGPYQLRYGARHRPFLHICKAGFTNVMGLLYICKALTLHL